MDLIVRAPRVPAPGETVLGDRLVMLPGGKGANQAVAAARLGAATAIIGRVGEDGFGQAVRSNLAQAGVDAGFVTIDPGEATGVAMITVGDDGQNSIVVAPGANARLAPGDVVAALASLAGAHVLVLQLEIPLETVEAAVSAARARGIVVILNAAPARLLSPKLLARVDVLVVNESEAALLARLPAGSQAGPTDWARALLALGVGAVVITLGAHGAFVASTAFQQHVAGIEVHVVDTTGAGDAFVGGLAVALADGQPLPEAVAFANVVGALATTQVGAQAALPTRAAVGALRAQSAGRQAPS